MSATVTYSYANEVVRYYGFVAKGAYEGELVAGYGFYTLNGRCYIYGHLAFENATVPHWYRVKPEEIHYEVIPRRGRIL